MEGLEAPETVTPLAVTLANLQEKIAKQVQAHLPSTEATVEQPVIAIEESEEILEDKDNFGDFLGKLKDILANPKDPTVPEVKVPIVEEIEEEIPVEVPKAPIVTATPKNDYIQELERQSKPPAAKKTANDYTLELDKLSTDIISETEPVKMESIKKLLEEYMEKYLKKAAVMAEYAGGGGSVAQQFANGGTMNGTLNVTGQYLSGGVDIATLFSTGSGSGGSGNAAVNSVVISSSANWNNTYTTVQGNSASWGAGGTPQTLSFNSNTAALSISNGNTVSLSALSATSTSANLGQIPTLSANWNSSYTTLTANSASWNSVYSYVNSTSATNNPGYNATTFSKLSSQAFTYIPSTSSVNTVIGNNILSGYGIVTPNQNHPNYGYICNSSILGGCNNALYAVGTDANDSGCSDGAGTSCITNSIILGGVQNQICNTASGYYSSVAFGNSYSNVYNSVILTGNQNLIRATNCGLPNSCTGSATILGGSNNTISSSYGRASCSTITNGVSGYIGAALSFIGNGSCNTVNSGLTFIGTGCNNTINGGGTSALLNGICNSITGAGLLIGNGCGNNLQANYSTILNGTCNVNFCNFSNVLNGSLNCATALSVAINNGFCNTASSQYSTIVNGKQNTATYGLGPYPRILLHFDSFIGIADSSIYGLTVTNPSNLTVGVSGKFNNGIYFPGSAFLAINTNSPIGTGNFSVDLWFNNSGNNTGFILGNYTTGSAGNPRIYVNNGNISYRTTSTGSDLIISSFTPNVWNHVALSRVSGTTTLYLNGVSVGTYADSANYSNNWNFRLGIGNSGGGSFYTGYIDEVRVFNGYSPYSGNFTPPTAPYSLGSSSVLGGVYNSVYGDNSSIIGGTNNTLSANNSFILGSNIFVSAVNNFTFVNNISSQGLVYDGTGNSSQWNSTFTTVSANSANWNTAYTLATGLTSLSSNWQSTYTTVSSNSANWNTSYTLVQNNSAGWNNPLSAYSFITNGSTSIFNLSTTAPFTNAAAYIVSLNGAIQTPTTDFTITYSGTNYLNLNFTPRAGALIDVQVLGNGVITNSSVVTVSSSTYNPLYAYVNSNFSVNVPTGNYMVDTTTSGVTGVLPTTPTIGTVIGFMDPYYTWATNNFTLSASTNIENQNQTVAMNIAGFSLKAIYVGGTYGWRLVQ